MMIGLAGEDGHGTIELLHDEKAYHLVAERHLAEADFLGCQFVDGRRKAIGTAYYEHQPAGRSGHAFLHPSCKIYAATLAPMLVQQDHIVARLQQALYLLALALLLHSLGEVARLTQIGHYLYLEGEVVAQTGSVLVDYVAETSVLGLPDSK